MASRQQHDVSTGWKWRLANSNGDKTADDIQSLQEWSDAKSFPSVIHSELLAKGVIPDYKVGENERQIQWVGVADWAYSTSFGTPATLDASSSADLVFEGLDTFAIVVLNDKEILRCENMFRPYRVNVKEMLRPSGELNELSIVFESTCKRGDELEKKYGPRKGACRDHRRNHIRKAQVGHQVSRYSRS